MRRSALLLFLSMALPGCSRTHEAEISDWCRVRVREPLMGGGGMVQAGPDEKETLYVRRGGGWSEVGHGTRGSVTLLAGGRALLWAPTLGAALVVVTPDGATRPASALFPCTGFQTISPDGAWVDCGMCASGSALSCQAVALERRTSEGSPAGIATADAKSEGCRFRRPGVAWYDTKGRAYALAECPDGSRALYRADFVSSVERFASPRPIDDARSWYEPVGRLALSDPKGWHRLRESPGRSVRR